MSEPAGLEAIEKLEAEYSADSGQATRQVQLFTDFLKGREGTEELFREYVNELQKRVVNGTMAASSLATYMTYVTNSQRYRHMRGCRAMRAIKAQGSHLGGKHRAPRMDTTLARRIMQYIAKKPMSVLKAGMWLQARMAAPRCVDVSRLRREHFMPDRKKTHWAFTKSIRNAADAKTTPALKMSIRPPFSLAWWEAQAEQNGGQPLKEYNSVECNKELERICEGYHPKPTSTSLRLIFIDEAVEKAGGDYDAAARYTVHKTGQVLAAAYDGPRPVSKKQ